MSYNAQESDTRRGNPAIGNADRSVRGIDSVRQQLQFEVSDRNETEANADNITVDREYSFLDIDGSMLGGRTKLGPVERTPEQAPANQIDLKTETPPWIARDIAGPSQSNEQDNMLQEILQNIMTRLDKIEQAPRNETTQPPEDGNTLTNGRATRRPNHTDLGATCYMKLKEARDMIPTFDGSQAKVKEFVRACTYAQKAIHPRDETSLLESILCTKLKGRALIDFETREIYNMEQLQEEIRTSYSSKRNASYLQVEFNTLRQKYGENAQEYGSRVDTLALELYESLVEGTGKTADAKRAVLASIREQALNNFQMGLRAEIKTIIRAQRYKSLPEAVAGAAAEEKANGLTRKPRGQEQEKYARPYQSQPQKNRNIICLKCGKPGHYKRDCRSSTYALPRPEGRPRVNAILKVCTHCRKKGHSQEECWFRKSPPGSRERKNNRPTEGNRKNETARPQKNTDESDNDSEDDKKSTRHARKYQVAQAVGAKDITLATIDLPVLEAKRGKLDLLYDTGAALSLVKVKHLKGDTIIYGKENAVTGVTGRKLYTLGKMKATIKLRDRVIRHPIHVVKDDFPMEFDGILGLDFLQKYRAICNYTTATVEIGRTAMKLRPHRIVTLPPRSETIAVAKTDCNNIGIVQAEELSSGIFIGSCLVAPENYSCPVSIVNVTEQEVTIREPSVTIEEIPTIETPGIYHTERSQSSKPTPPRATRVLNALQTKHLNNEEIRTATDICEEFHDIFHLEGDQLTFTTLTSHKIAVKRDTAPTNVRPYRLPEKQKAEVDKQVKEMIRDKIIRHSTSQWNAPLLVVPKKPDAQGRPRMRVVVDFRKLNDITIGDSFPLPNITDILDQLGNAKYFTTLDLASGYHQIQVAKEDKEKTAFSTPYGHYEFNRMPFGLKNAPATFQRLMNTVLAGLQGIKCLVYLDDIVIYGHNLEEHYKRIREVLKRLRVNNLKLQPEKCQFLRKEVTYLGHKITEEGIKPDPTKIEAVKRFPTPKKIRDIQAFIGLAGYYRKFIENFSKIAKPLTKLTKKSEKFEWNTEQQNAFESLKERLITAPVLKHPDFNEEFIVTTDASGYAIGAILSQGPIGKDKPIAYASRILARAEQNYSTTEKELLAIVWAVRHFRPYLYGTTFKIVTDHKALVWLFNINDPGSRLIRWRLKLEEYNYEIIHKAGKINKNADALSRYPPGQVCQVRPSEEEEARHHTGKERVYNEEERQVILKEYHDAPIGGHQGIERTLKRIRITHDWPGIKRDVEKYIKKCELCQKNKLSTRIKAPLIITDTPEKPFEKCALDIVGPLTETSSGNRYVLTFQDNLTKFSKAMPIVNQEAATIAEKFVVGIILEYGIPEKILTDQGTNFLSEIFGNVCKLLKIEKIQTTAYHPQSNGALERSHRTLAEYLRHYINADQTDWDKWLPYAMFAYNTTPHSATGYTPFELIYGHNATLPSSLKNQPKLTYTYDDYAQELKEKLRATNQIAKEHLKQEKDKAKRYQDKRAKEPNLKVGDKVLLHDETVRRGRSKKLDALWIGPYAILEKHANANFTIKKGRRLMRVHANRLKHFIEN